MEKNGTIKPLFLSSYTQYEASLKKLLALEAEVLALAHNTAIKGRVRVREFLAARSPKRRRLKEKIIDLAGPEPMISAASPKSSWRRSTPPRPSWGPGRPW